MCAELWPSYTRSAGQSAKVLANVPDEFLAMDDYGHKHILNISERAPGFRSRLTEVVGF